MNKTKKKLFGAAGLSAVAAMTFIAVTIPSTGAYAANATLPVTVNVSQPSQFSATFSSLINGAQLIDSTGTIDISYTNATDLDVVMTSPDGATTTPLAIPTITNTASGTLSAPFAFLDGYGDYRFTLSGLDLNSDPTGPVSSIVVSYHSAFFDILPPDDNGDPVVNVTFGPEVCGVRFTITSVDDPSKAPTYFPSLAELPIDCVAIDTDGDGQIQLTIPLSTLGLEPGRYKITMTTYGCTPSDTPDPDDIIESDLPPSSGTDTHGNFTFDPHHDYTPPEVPDTGFITIGGMVIAKKDLAITALVAAIATAIAYFAIKSRRHIKR